METISPAASRTAQGGSTDVVNRTRLSGVSIWNLQHLLVMLWKECPVWRVNSLRDKHSFV